MKIPHTSFSLVLLTSILSMMPFKVFAQNFSYIDNVFSEIGDVIATAVPVLVGLALLLFIWGLVVFITQTDDDSGRESGRAKMIWGVIALFVIISVWGLVSLLQDITEVDGDLGTINAPEVPE